MMTCVTCGGPLTFVGQKCPKCEDRERAPDPVNHPAHYRQGSMEVIDAIEGLGLGFHAGNVVKYVARYKMKGGVEDLEKAEWYLRRLIEREKLAAEGM